MDGEGYPTVRAVYDYTGRSDKELSFEKGDVITVTDIIDDTWWEGELNGQPGFIAAAYVEQSPMHCTTTTEEGAAASELQEERREGEVVQPVAPKKLAELNKDRPDLAKALKIHQAKAKHEVVKGPAGNARTGVMEFKAQLAAIKTKTKKKVQQEESELTRALNKQNLKVVKQVMEEEEHNNMSELQKKFTKRGSSSNSLGSTASGAGGKIGFAHLP